jgi:hypothetical protein
MPDFDLERLITLLEDPMARVSLVVMRIEEEASDEQGAQASARYLTLDDALRTRFRNGLRRALLPLRTSPPVPYEYGWVNLDDSVAEAEEAILEGPILTTVREAIGGDVERDFAPPPVPHDDDEAAVQNLIVGAYVAVVRRDGFPTALFFRRRDPVERLGQQRFSGILDGGRLTKADRIFIFDSTYDVAAFDGGVLVRNAAAYEALFSNVVIRRQGARTAVTTLLGRMPVANLADLDHVIETDTRFAGRLRAIDRRGQLANLDPDAVRRTTARFRIDHRMIRGDELVFVPAWRWHWLSILETASWSRPVPRPSIRPGSRTNGAVTRSHVWFEMNEVGLPSWVATLAGSPPRSLCVSCETARRPTSLMPPKDWLSSMSSRMKASGTSSLASAIAMTIS